MVKTIQDSSPRDLLREPTKVRLEYFNSRTIKHPLLISAFDEAQSAILDSIPGSIILLFGPTGVGKSTLLERLCESLTESLLADLQKDKGRFPVVLVQLDSPLPGRFEWKDYFRSLLIELNEPEVERKINIDQWPQKKLDTNAITSILAKESNNHISGGAMRVSAREALKYRNPLAVLVDDAQHFGQIGSGRKLLDQLNIIKSMAEKSDVIHVLCGTYELLPFLNLNGQLSRRVIDVHFGRYHAEDRLQQDEFINALYTFQQYLPLDEIPDLVSQWDYFYEGSIGCIGILKDWLSRALSLALKAKSYTLLPEHLKSRALSVAKRSSILSEILIGERDLKEEESVRAKLRIDMGLKQEIKELTLKASKDNQREDASDHTPNVRRKRRKSPVGRRSPKRDKIGKKVA
jgi:energy-coupling factor transporter ATP-binding protein EcfA2